MSGVAIVRALLAAHPPLQELVPANKIFAGVIPQGTVLPAVGVSTISESEQGTTARALSTKMIRERVQVTVQVKDNYVLMKQINRATALGPGVKTGIVGNFVVRSVLPWGAGPEIPAGDDKIYEQSRDFMVTFIEAN